MLTAKKTRILKSYWLDEDIVEELLALQHVYGYTGERDASNFMNAFLDTALKEAAKKQGHDPEPVPPQPAAKKAKRKRK